MFDIAWTEMMVIGAVALVVIGPKDLPKVLKTVGALVNKARGMAREFQGGIDEMIRESELDELRKAARLDVETAANKILDPAVETGPVVSPPPQEPRQEPVELPQAGEAYVPPDGATDGALAGAPEPAAKPVQPT